MKTTMMPSQAIKVKDHREWAMCDYTQSTRNQLAELGQVLYKDGEIGVVIQLHEDGDIRVDMWGNCSPSECQYATMEQIMSIRPSVLGSGKFVDRLKK